MSHDMLDKMHQAMATLEESEVRLICAAVLHGVPLSRLASASLPQEKLQTQLMASLKKLRTALAAHGLDSNELARQIK